MGFRSLRTAALLLVLTTVFPGITYGEEWAPSASIPKTEIPFDWIRLTNGEWLNGEIISLRNRELIFDSDHFDEITIDWEDVAELHSAGDLIIVLGTNETLTGKVSMVGDILVIRGKGGEKTRGEITSIIPRKRSWWATWDGGLSLGVGFITGNVNQLNISIRWDAIYRAAFQRYSLGYTGTISQVSGSLIANSHRATGGWDWYIGDRLFVSPLSYSFYHNSFQNIRQQHTPEAGIGYTVIERTRVDWDLTAGVGYQMHEYVSVLSGSPFSHDLIISAGTVLNWDITDDIEWNIDYSARFNFINNLNFSQNLATDFALDITKNLELEVALDWNYIQNPQQKDDGTYPKKNDLDMTVGIGFTY